MTLKRAIDAIYESGEEFMRDREFSIVLSDKTFGGTRLLRITKSMLASDLWACEVASDAISSEEFMKLVGLLKAEGES